MNWVDIVIIAVVGISSIFGLWRGLVKEVFSLVTWVAALIVARVYSTSLAPLFTGIFDGETTRYVAAFTLLFIITIMVGAMINHLLSRLLSVAGLKFTDRLLGGIFGIARGGIIVMMFVFVLSGLLSTNITWQQSRLIPYSVSMIEWSRIFVSDLSLLDEPVEADEIL